ncbi:MAG: DNA replication/repair protein RecF [Candidatus Hydrogenedentota bacterium]
MHITRMSCDGFRCLRKVDIALSPVFNVIRGQNAQGKTSLLEAILFATTSKSHRTTNESDLVDHEGDRFQIHLDAQRSDRRIQLDANYYRGAKRYKVNGVAQSRVSDILGKINTVFFSPEDITLVKGSASLRRKFLDMELSQLHAPYLNALQQYRQILRQRNELLRHPKPDDGLLEIWEVQLVEHGSLLIKKRERFIEQLTPLAVAAYHRIAGDETLSLKYQADVNTSEDFEAILRDSRQTDIRRRVTTRGPHRDDIDFHIDGQPARSIASQGQQKSAALALKLAELEWVRERIGEYPVLMLDEVLAELDPTRSAQLFDAIDPQVQCIITTTQPDLVERLGDRPIADFVIEGGRVTACQPQD